MPSKRETRRLGCIADDFTGASDLANALAGYGLRIVQFNGVPTVTTWQWDAAVISLKTRSTRREHAVRQSLEALSWLRSQGCDQFYFKYCSTFDSTPEGNIGPVAEALLTALDAGTAIVCPAFPSMKRTIYNNYLFVDGVLLNESGMEHHPLNPMTDASLSRWLGRQTSLRIGKLGIGTVREGAARMRAALAGLAAEGARLVICDCLADIDLETIGRAVFDAPLLTGGSGLATGLMRAQGRLRGRTRAYPGLGRPTGRAVALAGSCSSATREQIRRHLLRGPACAIDIAELMADRLSPTVVAKWVENQPLEVLPLVYSSADPAFVTRMQERYGAESVAERLEGFFGELARLTLSRGIDHLIIAGGETSSAVVTALGIDAMRVGPEIDPGVPVLYAEKPTHLSLALKSGNFGAPDFFHRALRRIRRTIQ
jgi:uncharacterized protein YgbK (DUF1537 family)